MCARARSTPLTHRSHAQGYDLNKYLKTLGLNLIKPTEMTKGKMTENQAATSRRISQARAHSERVVFRVRCFDIFNGRKVHQPEFPMLDVYKDLVCSLVMCQGPLSSRGESLICLLIVLDVHTHTNTHTHKRTHTHTHTHTHQNKFTPSTI